MLASEAFLQMLTPDMASIQLPLPPIRSPCWQFHRYINGQKQQVVLRYIVTPQKNSGSIWKHILTAPPPPPSFLLANSRRWSFGKPKNPSSQQTSGMFECKISFIYSNNSVDLIKNKQTSTNLGNTQKILTSPIQPFAKALGMMSGASVLHLEFCMIQPSSIKHLNFPFGWINEL